MNMPGRTTILSTALVVALILVSCSGSGPGPECRVDMDCSGLHICRDGECVYNRCAAGCPSGTYCIDTECIDCADDRHCGTNCIDCTELLTDHACIAGECGCESEVDCAAGEECVGGSCSGCTPDCMGKCGGASDSCNGTCDDACSAGLWCDNQACVVCDSDEHCGAGCSDCTAQASNQVCVNTSCGCVDINDCAANEECQGNSCVGLCGNGDPDPGEACDDGNTQDGDECNADCTLACLGGKTFGLHCYLYDEGVGIGLSWVEAQQYCEGLGMHLVTIESDAEAAFVSYSLGVSSSFYIWIGLNDMNQEGSWVWVNGEQNDFRNWRDGQPDNDNQGEDCAAMWYGDVDWLDQPCLSTGHEVVCETEPNAATQVCGNDQIEGGEACDDNNSIDGDECNAACSVDCTGGRTYGLHCYKLGASVDWATGLAYCQSLGMDYAAVSSADEESFIEAYRDEAANNQYLWIGYNDIDQEGTWVWTNGETPIYTKWAGNEPDNTNGLEHCCTIFRVAPSLWWDHPCDFTHVPVCEK
jgi:lectin-like protein